MSSQCYYVNRRKQRRTEILKELSAMVVFIIAVGVITVGILNYSSKKDDYYYVGTEDGYEQLVDRPCIVREVNADLVTVETINGGELYNFYGDEYKVGETIICTFNMADELIDAK